MTCLHAWRVWEGRISLRGLTSTDGVLLGLCCELSVKGLTVWWASLVLGPSWLGAERCACGAEAPSGSPWSVAWRRVVCRNSSSTRNGRLSGGAGERCALFPAGERRFCLRRLDGARTRARSGRMASATFLNPHGFFFPPHP